LALDLFGSVEGQSRNPGLLEKADGGSIFLDEVAELPLSLQPKLLRVVQNQEFTPVGSASPIRINVRFISSTQRRLEEEAMAGRFRNDLYYRLGVLSITLPPLRDRGEDVLLLAEHFLKEHGHDHLSITASAKKALLAYQWPGNVRELRNVIIRAATFSSGQSIDVDDLPAEITRTAAITSATVAATTTSLEYSTSEAFGLSEGVDSSLQEKRLELERVYLLKLLEDSRGNVTHAAQKANMSRQGFHKLLKRHQISAADYR
ncbi:MAG: sigma 54-interacting transcriptional regulator, partial [Pirellulales bacterium]